MGQMVSIKHLKEILPFAGPWIQKAIDRNGMGYTLEDVVDGLHRGVYQLWADAGENHSGFVVTETIRTALGLEVHAIMAGGFNLEAWLPQVAAIELWAKEIGAYEIKVWGRLGWAKKLKPLGYTVETQVLRRPLDFEVQ